MPARRAARTALALAAAACLAAAAGCGENEEDRVRQTLSRLQTATAQKDYATLCRSVLSRSLTERVESIGLRCESALRRGLSGVRQPSIRIERIRVRGDVALAEVTSTAVGQRPSRDTIRLVREGDDWRVSSLSGVQPPAPPPPAPG